MHQEQSPPLNPPLSEQEQEAFEDLVADLESERPVWNWMKRVSAGALVLALLSPLTAPEAGLRDQDERRQTSTTVVTPDQQVPSSPAPIMLPSHRP